jgi:transcriptional regulator with XRE-family HTH domain
MTKKFLGEAEEGNGQRRQLGEYLRRIRESKGLTRAGLDKAIWKLAEDDPEVNDIVNVDWITRVERGQQARFSRKILELYREALQCTDEQYIQIIKLIDGNMLWIEGNYHQLLHQREMLLIYEIHKQMQEIEQEIRREEAEQQMTFMAQQIDAILLSHFKTLIVKKLRELFLDEDDDTGGNNEESHSK